MIFGTNADEGPVTVPSGRAASTPIPTLAIPANADTDTANTGFCISYQEK